ncbi:hypothetical protein HO173_010752 [Letharia columbiana]|uniref:Uncharacterized protein n=1 Tax=Letharia columbiana TaxID=112416 RepID=A0A8H6FM36_9LECA|nr:uncharacterized protein HO173_010752 [Letharia columbiana]KAF6231052.1 hypothetical protein HO173_010752 [Letharia columbiana]
MTVLDGIQANAHPNSSDNEFGNSSAFYWSVSHNFINGIPELLSNITLSIIAANAPTYNTTCHSPTAEILYEYNPEFLLLTYGLGLLATLCCLAAGLYALQHNGVAMDSTFSEIAAATRNTALGQVLADEGHTVAARKSARYLEQRVRYGELVKEYGDGEDTLGPSKGERRAAFGLLGQVTRLKNDS